MNIDKFVIKWAGVDFESSCSLTPQFAEFRKEYVAALKELLKEFPELHMIYKPSTLHFAISGFIKNMDNGKYVYWSIPDVRSFKMEWLKNIMIRTAKHDHDYSGGKNNYTCFKTFAKDVKALTIDIRGQK